MPEQVYRAAPTLWRFHQDDTFIRGVRGPVGSGKTTALIWEFPMRCARHYPGKLTRGVVVRNTYRELKDTVIADHLEWFPESTFGKFHHDDMIHRIRYGDIKLDLLFRALDKPTQVKKLRSLNLTFAAVSEAGEVPYGAIKMLRTRIGRYPRKKKGIPLPWFGMWMETNSPDDDSWWYRMFEEVRPKKWRQFVQPGGMDTAIVDGKEVRIAENLDFLPDDYYETLIESDDTDDDFVKVYVHNNYGFAFDGKKMFPEYNDALHALQENIDPMPGLPIVVGIDFGLTPAGVFMQLLPSGRWVIYDELVTEDMGAAQFGEVLFEKIEREYKGFEFEFYGDPAGEAESEADKNTPFKALADAGIKATKAPTQDPTQRREAIAKPLRRLIDGKPGLQICPRAKVTRKGLRGGYCRRRLQIAGVERYSSKPDKNRFSHPCEGTEYGILGHAGLPLGTKGEKVDRKKLVSSVIKRATGRG